MIHVRIVNRERIPAMVAEDLRRQLERKPDSVLGLPTGSTPLAVYRELVARQQQGKIDFSRATTFNLDEYIGLDGTHAQSYKTYMYENFFRHVNIDLNNTHIPNGAAGNLEEECRRYEKLMEQSGGIDWLLLGIGRNGHIGFNEPGESLIAETHVQKLQEETRSANARFFGSLQDVPTHAITMGMGSILKAGKIVLIAFGKEKADILAKAVNGPVTTWVPASFLQLHRDVTFVLDHEAASGLEPSGVTP
jgi:glucosamine-6-phosphate deaminase